ncbi:hypothetical protein K449DRAFT_135379 [Hypoxylon sp. EC38]|nr:hypothetical protein K449DRAFT_135379 [Hypoxylon sp. EC38]
MNNNQPQQNEATGNTTNTPQTYDLGRKKSVKLLDKEPFGVRANPLVHEEDPKFLAIESYFKELLNNSMLTIDQIIYGTFEAHEILLLEPTTFPPELVQLQRDNTVRYQQILESRFKDRAPSLQLKLAMLYFGLPVAPMKPGVVEVNLPMDVDFAADETTLDYDPLRFLDEHTERTYGEEKNRVISPYLQRPLPTQVLPSMKLRGGNMPESVDSESEASNVPLTSANRVRVWGFQGSVLTKPSNSLWLSFIEAVDHLLGVEDLIDYRVCVEIWNLNDVEKPVSRTEGMIHHGILKSPDEDPIYTLVQKWFSDASLAKTHECFVNFDKESPPPFYQPPWKRARYIVRVWDEETENMSYMKVPTKLELTHKPNQYLTEYQRAMRVLFPDSSQQYTQFTTVSAGDLSYGLFDPPPVIWNQIVEEQAKNGQLPSLNFRRIPMPPNCVAVWIPGFHSYNTDFWTIGSSYPESFVLWSDLFPKPKGEDHRASLSKLLATVATANPSASSSDNRVGLDLWVPGEKFLDVNNKPDRVDIRNNEISMETLFTWRRILLGFQARRVHAQPQPMSIVARPVFDSYRFSRRGNLSRSFILDINREDATLAVFKASVRAVMYSEYTGDRKDQVLHLVQSTWAKNQVEFAIRSEMTEEDWELIVRRITEPDIIVSLEQWTNDWDVEEEGEQAIWGPRYNLADIAKFTSVYESLWKPTPFDGSMNRLFSRSDNNRDGADRAEKLRQRFFWDIPSIFTNPTKPGIPIHGTPVETIIRTGPNVPGFTTAMRTPSEVARLEREVHTLRGNILEKIRECPYMDCNRYFPFKDGDGLARHLREDHTILRCFLCTKQSTLLPYYDGYLIRKHFLDEHHDELKEYIGSSAGRQPSSTGSAYCNRCGRSEAKLGNPKDQTHHNQICSVGNPSSTRYCMFCGRATGYHDRPCICGKSTTDRLDPGNFCVRCGLEYDSKMDRAYREIHRQHCMAPGGQLDDFCRNCGIILADLSDTDKAKHMSSCGDQTHSHPPDSPTHPVASTVTSIPPPPKRSPTPGDPEIELTIDELGRTIDALNEKYNAVRQSTPKRKGDPIDDTRREKRRRKQLEGKEIPHGVIRPIKVPAKRRLVLWREATKEDEVPKRRSRSPNWRERLESVTHFVPNPEWRCSRCFRAAGSNINEIEMHMDPRRSCRIRRGLGTTLVGKTPNRSGWIVPDEGFDFNAAYYDFVKKYPAYRYTMFPVRDENVKEVWSEPYDLEEAVGSVQDDPNFRGPLFMQTRSWELPWPPYEGTIIPLTYDVPPPSPTDDGSEDYGSEDDEQDDEGDDEGDDDGDDGRDGGGDEKNPSSGNTQPGPTRPTGALAQAIRQGTSGNDRSSVKPFTSGNWPSYGLTPTGTSSMPPGSARSRATFASGVSKSTGSFGTSSSYRPSTSGSSSVPLSSDRSLATSTTHEGRPSSSRSARPATIYSSRSVTRRSTGEEDGSEAPSTRSRTRAQAREAGSLESRSRSGRTRRGQP